MLQRHVMLIAVLLISAFVAGGCGGGDKESEKSEKTPSEVNAKIGGAEGDATDAKNPERAGTFVECITKAGYKPAGAATDVAFAKPDADAATLASDYVTVIAGEPGVEGESGELSVTALGNESTPDKYQLLVINREDGDAFSMSGVVADPSSVAAVYYAQPAPEAARSQAEACNS